MNFCILISTYNEANNIEKLLDRLQNYDVIIIDDSSPDGTAELASKYKNVTVVVRKNKRGIASAYIDGFKWVLNSGKEYAKIVQMDAGLTHNPDDIPHMIEASNFCDLLIGSRNLPARKTKSYRTLISKTAVLLMRFLKINLKDVTSGFRIWDVELLKKINFDKVKSKGFSFQLELLHQAFIDLNANVKEYYIEYKLTNSSFNLKILLEAIKIWLLLLKKTYLG